MKRTILLLLVASVTVTPAIADITLSLEQADELQDEEQYEAQMDLLESILSEAAGDAERAEVYWRMSRATLGVADLAKDAGRSDDVLLEIYGDGEGYADKAIELDATNHNSYFYKSANIGRAGQVKGVLNSLMSASTMRDLLKQTISYEPTYGPAYFVLGQLYAQVPGMISFGNDDYAVSFARKSIDLHEAEMESGEADGVEYGYYIQLASHLIERGWNQRKRNREHSKKEREFNQTDDILERHFYYEGVTSIPSVDDEREARDLLERMIGLLQALPSRSPSENRNLNEAKELLASL